MPTSSPDTLDQMKRVFRGWFRRDKRPTKMLQQQRGPGRQISNGNVTNANAQAAATAAARLQPPTSTAPPPTPPPRNSARPTSVPLFVAAGAQSRYTTPRPFSLLRISSDMVVSPITPPVAEEPAAEEPVAAERDGTRTGELIEEAPSAEESSAGKPTIEDAKTEEPSIGEPATKDPTIGGFVFSDAEHAEPVKTDHEEAREKDDVQQEPSGTEPHAITTENMPSPGLSSPPVEEDIISDHIPMVDDSEDTVVGQGTRRKDSSMADLSEEEQPYANDAARRSPAAFHDEKIPVFAEPPVIRMIIPAEGMVATSGPLEDFPFR